jgi:hypothetical protein
MCSAALLEGLSFLKKQRRNGGLGERDNGRGTSASTTFGRCRALGGGFEGRLSAAPGQFSVSS